MQWIDEGEFEDIAVSRSGRVLKITINRPEVHNAFRPLTLSEMAGVLWRARDDKSVGVVLLTGAGQRAFCAGGDQKSWTPEGYTSESDEVTTTILDIQSLIRRLPKPVVAMVHGYAIGGGQVLQMMCDLSVASETAVFGHAGPRVGSIDGGYGIGLLAQTVGQRRAREMWYLCRQYSARDALDMGLVNAVVPAEEVEREALGMAETMLQLPPTTLRLLKSAFNALDDGLAGMQQFAGEATHAYYMTAESIEAHAAYRERRAPNFH